MTVGVGVAGVGSIGRHHARILAALPQAELVALLDPSQEALDRIPFPAARYTVLDDFLAHPGLQAVVVAVPTYLHSRVATQALGAGLHVLVEKPLAASVEEGRQLVRAASAANRVVAVGHVERFNPAVVELKRRLRLGELGRLFYVEARRAGPFPPQIADVGVTVDLATHDLDVLSYLLNANPEIVFAQVARHVHGAHEDLLIGTLRYPHGVVASLHINWLTPTKVRQLAVTGEGGMMVVDYLTQDLTWYENSVSVASWDALDTLRGVAEGRMIRFPIGRREPLAAELEAFIAAISKSGSEIVTADQGLRALTLADCLLASARVSQPIRAPLESPDSSKATADAVLQTETSVSQSPGG